TETYTLSLHDALPIWEEEGFNNGPFSRCGRAYRRQVFTTAELLKPLRSASSLIFVARRSSTLIVMRCFIDFLDHPDGCFNHSPRSEEHTSELQSLAYL